MGRDTTKRVVAGSMLILSGLVWNVHYGELSVGPGGGAYRGYVLVGGTVMSLGFGVVYGVWRSRGDRFGGRR
jgi:hypothetical protein